MQAIKKILLATDFSESSANALEQAAMLAAQNDAQLQLLHVNVEAVQVYGLGGLPLPTEISPELKKAAEKHLQKFSQHLELPVVAAVEWGFSASQVIHEYCQNHDIDLLVVGTHGRSGIRRFFLGSVAVEVVRSAVIPVLVVLPGQAPQKTDYAHLVTGVDFSKTSLAALDLAASIAATTSARLSAVHVISDAQLPPYYPLEFEEVDKEKVMRSLEKSAAIITDTQNVDSVVLIGAPHEELVMYAKEHKADLLVVGASGLGKVDRWLVGSLTDRVMRSAPCSVLVCPTVLDAS